MAVVAGPLDAAASAVLSSSGVPLAEAGVDPVADGTAIATGVVGEPLTFVVALRDAAGRALGSGGASRYC
jgi:hypothetical protein